MFNKISNRTLSIVFIVLLVLVIFSKIADHHHNNRTFKGELISYKSDQINKIIVHPQRMNGKSLQIIKRNNNQWFVKVDDNAFHADKNLTESIINTINHIRATRIASTQQKKWKEYKLTDSLATHLQLYAGSQLKADLRIGKTSSNGQQMVSYIRLNNDPTIYGVNSYSLSGFNRTENGYKSKTIINSSQNKWDQLTFSYPGDSSFTLLKTGTQWQLKNAQADSAGIASYLSSIEHIRHYKLFSKIPSKNPQFVLKIDGAQLNQTIELDGYTIGKDFILGSSQNPGVYFQGNDLKQKLFKTEDYFMRKIKGEQKH